MQTQSHARDTVLAVVERRLAVVCMRNRLGAVCDSELDFFGRCTGVTDGNDNAMAASITGQSQIRIVFRSKGNDLDVVSGSFLVFLEFINGRRNDCLGRLCTLVLHIEVRSFEVDAQDIGTIAARLEILLDVTNVFNRLHKNRMKFGNGRGHEACDTFVGDVLRPVAQSIRLCIVCVIAVGTVAMDVDEARYDSQIAIVEIRGTCVKRKDLFDLPIFNVELGRDKFTADPDT